MVETIQQIQKTQTQIKGPSTSTGGWNTTWSNMLNTNHVEAQKYQEVVNSQEKLIIVKKIFLNINRQMLEISYILSLGQLLKIAPELKRYLWQKLKLEKTQNVSRTTTNKQVGFSVLEIGTTIVAINNHIQLFKYRLGKIQQRMCCWMEGLELILRYKLEFSVFWKYDKLRYV